MAPTKDHKCMGARCGWKVTCECGKSFGPYYGEGARRAAYKEWHWHIDQVHKERREQGLIPQSGQ